MRPVRLEIEGFTAFRARTEVDLAGVELFAFTGPTGSGKSSLVDAMVFALYGRIPRLDGRSVAPIVSLGAAEAKLRLDFLVGADAYTAVRVVRRTKAGATTKEARLERSDGEVLAGNAEEVTEAVTGLLGLSYDHFIKCVVLPQGAFATFLHDSGADRQGLLVKLLDLGLYERMAAVAHRRERAARSQVDQLTGQRNALAAATPAAVAAAEARVATLATLEADAAGWAKQLADLHTEAAAAQAAEAEAAERRRSLNRVVVPDGVADRAEALTTARHQVGAAEQAAKEALEASDAADAAVTALPPRAELEAASGAHADLAGLRADHQACQADLAAAAAAAAHADDALRAAESAVASAATALDTAQWHHRARDLAAHLVAGEPCPVCEQAVAHVPVHDHGDDPVAAARAAKEQADHGRDRARKRAAAAAKAHASAEATVGGLTKQMADLEARIATWPDAEVVGRRLAELDAAERVARDARTAARAAEQRAASARREAGELEAAQAGDLDAFDQARDRVAVLGPPAADRGDLAAAWHALAAWAASQLPHADAALAAARMRSATAHHEATAVRQTASSAFAEAGLALGPDDDLNHVVAGAGGAARAELDRLRVDVERVRELDARLSAVTRDAELAHALGQHLSARGFEKWVLDEALVELTVGATEILRTLSDGAYSLALDDKANFVVVDHRNADARRSARTLSGGETFLASLALALALADQVASLAADGAARIESIFLDEGFGTLDPDTLDTVAAAIEELGSRGRMVGLISHVAELAERVPVRFEVTRDPAGSTVEKVGA